jgi:hypothetical protein
MKNSLKHCLCRGHLISRALLLGLASAMTSQAAVTINSSFTQDIGTSLYTYTYSVDNLGPLDLALVSIPVSAESNVFDSSSPTGFSMTFDSFSGFISLLEDSSLFTDQSFSVGSNTGPFQFTSALAPGSVTYTAFDVGGNEFSGLAVAPIPEPSASLLAGAACLTILIRRRGSNLA